jgi:hypothetical protein
MTSDPKPRSNHREYIRILRRMTPEQRLLKAIELTDLGRSLFMEGLRRRHPHLDAAQLRALYLARIARCHSRTC